MTVLISGSVAIDTLLSSPFPFVLDATQVANQRLAVSYYMPELRHEWGGCAANIGYALKLLGGDPLIMATVGEDSQAYLARLMSLGIRTEAIKVITGQFTAKAVIMSDNLGQQITGFHPGAMNDAHVQDASPFIAATSPVWAIVSPDGKQGMLERSAQLKASGISFIADPGQAMPIMDQADLTVLMAGAACLAVNEHEATMLEKTLQTTVSQLSRTLPVLVTLGDKGLAFWEHGVSTNIPSIAVTKPIDPTGCGDSFRGAWLHGLTLGWSMLDALRLGNLMGAHKVVHQGAQGYEITMNALKDMWHHHYAQAWPSTKAS
jgi:adenosine kinase